MIFSSKDQKKSVMNVKEKDIWQWEKNVKTPHTSRPAMKWNERHLLYKQKIQVQRDDMDSNKTNKTF